MFVKSAVIHPHYIYIYTHRPRWHARELRYKSRVIDQRTVTLPTSLLGTFFMSRDTISSLAVLAAWTVAGK